MSTEGGERSSQLASVNLPHKCVKNLCLYEACRREGFTKTCDYYRLECDYSCPKNYGNILQQLWKAPPQRSDSTDTNSTTTSISTISNSNSTTNGNGNGSITITGANGSTSNGMIIGVGECSPSSSTSPTSSSTSNTGGGAQPKPALMFSNGLEA
mmetsp:Transcript_45809/g.113859  ORF Transcript_45809/g.113859 Transcript_45809/m.113859 type:complete len:155 (-) Transcript_45809:135-599(-)